ncbi:MAG: right-handed parallel beta-helix repeat-containing protein [Myxococcota bacterium]
MKIWAHLNGWQILALYLALMGIPAHALGAVLEVDAAGGPRTFTTVQAAVDAAHSGDTVRIAPGFYPESVEVNGKALTLEGSGTAEQQVLDGMQVGSVMRIGPAEGTTVLRRLTLQRGAAARGAGLLAEGAQLELDQVRLLDNHARSKGGGAWISGGSVRIVESVVEGCSARSGGGIWLENTQAPEVLRSSFLHNRGMMGAAVHIEGSGALVSASLFLENGRTPTGEGSKGEISLTVETQGAQQIELTNNVFLRNGCCNLSVRAGGTPRIYNNVLMESAGYALATFYSRPDLAYNTLYHNVMGELKYLDGSGGLQSAIITGSAGNQALNPAFVGDLKQNAASIESYQLSPSSPCWDRGHPDASYQDLDGTRNDMGLFGGPEGF